MAVERMLTLVLPDGTIAAVSAADARRLADELWAADLAPGAALAAAKIVDALGRPAVLGVRVHFDERDSGALVRVAPSLDWHLPRVPPAAG
jgi:hypothetical protein